MPSLTWLGSLALVLPATPQGQVHVVDAAGGPGSDFTSIGAAIRKPVCSATIQG